MHISKKNLMHDSEPVHVFQEAVAVPLQLGLCSQESREISAVPLEQQENLPEPMEEKFPKKKVALILAFRGTAYQGMQANPNAKSIESELFKALCEADLVSAANASDQSKIALQRACRTDKGVHAAMQVVSAKLRLPKETSMLIDDLNKLLPQDIRVFDILRTVNTFSARTFCESRVYEYLLPTFVLERDPDWSIESLNSRAAIENSSANGGEVPSELTQSVEKKPKLALPRPFDDDHDGGSEVEEVDEVEALLASPESIDPALLQRQAHFRLPSSQFDLLTHILEKYEGIHRFHNFTIGKSINDKQSVRQIRSFSVSKPFLIPDSKSSIPRTCEWIRFRVHGNSFMLHQIRKFIGLAIIMLKSGASLAVVDKAYEATKVNIPKAPGLGLYLAETHFNGYKAKLDKLSSPHPPILYDNYKSSIEQFKERLIWSEIYEREYETHHFYSWLRALRQHAHEFAYLGTPEAD